MDPQNQNPSQPEENTQIPQVPQLATDTTQQPVPPVPAPQVTPPDPQPMTPPEPKPEMPQEPIAPESPTPTEPAKEENSEQSSLPTTDTAPTPESAITENISNDPSTTDNSTSTSDANPVQSNESPVSENSGIENPTASESTVAAPDTSTTPVEDTTVTPQDTNSQMENMQATMPLPTNAQPSEPAKPHKGGVNLWMILSFVLLAVIGFGAFYVFGMSKNQPAQDAMMPKPTSAVSPTLSVSLSPSPSGTQSAMAGEGTVSGKLCYPASGIPAGTITAKDTTTGKEYTQSYAGTGSGASSQFTFSLPAGMYHMKFVPTQYPTIVGYYTQYSTCVDNPNTPDCQSKKVNLVLSATVSANTTIQNVNVCDYYYPANNPPAY